MLSFVPRREDLRKHVEQRSGENVTENEARRGLQLLRKNDCRSTSIICAHAQKARILSPEARESSDRSSDFRSDPNLASVQVSLCQTAMYE